MSGNKRIVNGKIAQGKLRGKALADALFADLNHEENEGASKNDHDSHK